MQYRNDCGCACVAMLLAWKGLPTPSVNQLASETSLAINDNGLTTYQLKTLAQKHALSTHLRNDLTTNVIKTLIDGGLPVLMLINYGYIKGRVNQYDKSGHFVIVCGYDSANIIINDPDFYGPRTAEGERLHVPNDEFMAAIRYAPAAYQGLVPL